MNNQPDLFREIQAKEHAMSWAAQNHEAELSFVRDMAVKIASLKGEITIDDLREALPKIEWGSAWTGSIFKDPRFICSGFSPARHLGSHGRMVRRWRLK